MHRPITVVALSGGVDSAVCAALLTEAGERVVGLSMHLYDAAGTYQSALMPALAGVAGLVEMTGPMLIDGPWCGSGGAERCVSTISSATPPAGARTPPSRSSTIRTCRFTA